MIEKTVAGPYLNGGYVESESPHHSTIAYGLMKDFPYLEPFSLEPTVASNSAHDLTNASTPSCWSSAASW